MSLVVATQTLSNGELAATVALAALSLVVVFALFAYFTHQTTRQQAIEEGLITVAAQVTFSVLVITAVTLMMFAGVVTAAEGLPILSGLAGVIVGKARTLPKKG